MSNNITDLSVIVTSPSPQNSENGNTLPPSVAPSQPSLSPTPSTFGEGRNHNVGPTLQITSYNNNIDSDCRNHTISDIENNELRADENRNSIEPLVNRDGDPNNDEDEHSNRDCSGGYSLKTSELFGPTRRFNRIKQLNNNNRHNNVHSLDIDHSRRQHRRQMCSCEGACGCALGSTRSSLRSSMMTSPDNWSPPSYSLQALDIYFSNLEFGSRRCLPGHSKLKVWKSPESSFFIFKFRIS